MSNTEVAFTAACTMDTLAWGRTVNWLSLKDSLMPPALKKATKFQALSPFLGIMLSTSLPALPVTFLEYLVVQVPRSFFTTDGLHKLLPLGLPPIFLGFRSWSYLVRCYLPLYRHLN